jgi:hypothetical protein
VKKSYRPTCGSQWLRGREEGGAGGREREVQGKRRGGGREGGRGAGRKKGGGGGSAREKGWGGGRKMPALLRLAFGRGGQRVD